ncbi:MAG: hypothetical protein IT262_18100 [Saprospiraceae bacterium]|nr:hypothetical protein [Saprospiraceae bacterium]
MENDLTENKDPFLQRAIEYWLDSANELGYQPLFCEWLISKGYVLKYSIKNTNFEQGKDVLAVNPSGVPHAYQLKGGNINLNRWRTEVKPEIEAMIECCIQHPDIDKNIEHISYLVTNGEVEDAARVEIVALNEGKWKQTPLRIWTRGDLLTGFQGMADGILPRDAQTYKELIDFIFSDGTGLPNIARISTFFSQILNVGNVTAKKEQRRRDIAGAMLYATMIAGPYRKVENYDSTIRIMTLLLSLIFHVVDKYGLEDKYWIESYRIIWNDIITAAHLLEAEINTSGFETAFVSPADKDLVPFRKHSSVSILYALKLSEFINRDGAWKSILNPTTAKNYRESVVLWGEASFIPYIMIICIFKNFEQSKVIASEVSQTAISDILLLNGRNSKHPFGFLPPYYDIDFAVRLNLGILESEFEDTYTMGSHLLKPFIEILVRLNGREFIAKNWQEISYMHFEEFVPDDAVDYYLWKIPNGENLSIFPKKEKSWRELVEESSKYDGYGLPPTLKRFPAFMPFFLTVFPHRADSKTVGFLYMVSNIN